MQLAQIAAATHYVLLCFKWGFNVHFLGSFRHELHQSYGTLAGNRPGIIIGLGLDDALNQFFGEVELTQGGNSIASVRAARRGAEVALLPRDTFFKLIEGSPLTRDAIQDVAATRLAENIRKRNNDQ